MAEPSSLVRSSRFLPGRLVSDDVFRLLVDNVADYAIFVLDPRGVVCSWNEGARRLNGYEPGEIIGKHFSIFYTGSDLATDKPGLELRVASETGRYEDEGWRLRKDGSRFWANVVVSRIVDENGNLIGFGKITRDLTERRNAELRYRLLVESVADYAIFSMDKGGHIASWNVGAQRIKGYKTDEILGKHFSAFYTPEDRARDLPSHVLATAAREGHFEGEGWRVRKDGSRFWANVIVTAIRDDEGNLTGFSKVTRDITERKALLDEIQRHAAELELRVQEREEVNAELEAFAYSVSHDLRAPLRAIAGFSDALREEYEGKLDATARDYLGEIASATKRMNSLVQDLLEYGRISRIQISLDSVPLLSAVEQAVEQLGDGKSGALIVSVRPDLRVRAHPQMLAQAILNLLSNAFKFHPPAHASEVTVSAEARAGRVRLEVRDNGIGIAPQHQDRIWQVFERLHDRETYPGTGIGLAIVRRAITRMEGTCGVQSQVGAGSTFWIELPAGDIFAEERNE